jgi:hypothetical protein
VTRFIWGIIALIFVGRGIGAFTVPLTGDEAYYWEWSRRLAAGYVDHPPAVAWTIHLFAQFGQVPGLVRLGFVLCGVVASLGLAGCANEITGDKRAGAVAALAMAIVPLTLIAFGTASPDGPYLMFWSLALWFAARAFKRDDVGDWILLGLMVGGVLLSRVLGFALPFGLAAYALFTPSARHVWKRGMPIALAVCAVVCTPFIIWNAQHDWVTLLFGVAYRHEGVANSLSVWRVLSLLGVQAAAYSPGIWIAVLVLTFRPRNALLAWTAIPQFAIVTFLALFERVEIHWVFGFFASLCAMLGIAYVQISHRMKIVWTTASVVPAALLLPAIFAFTFAPVPIYRVIHRETGAQLRNAGPFEIMTYQMVADDAGALAKQKDAVVMTDGYGLSSVMDFDAGVAPVVIGYDWQGRESRSWFPDSERPARALFVDKEPLSTRPDIALHLRRACTRVVDGGIHAFSYGGVRRAYYYTWCEGLVPDGLAILRWEREPPVTAQARPVSLAASARTAP